MERSGSSTQTVWISLLAILTALTTIATVVLVIPIPATGGYLNFGDIMVMISGILLGPAGGFIAGGGGSMLADVSLGYVGFAPITLIVKGLEGLAVGYLSRRTSALEKIGKWDVIGVIIGSAVMLLGYLIAETLLEGFGPALVELITGNLLQVTVGSVLTLLVGPRLRAYLSSQGRVSESLQEAI